MKWGGRRLPSVFLFATLLVIGGIAAMAAAATSQGYEVGETIYQEGESHASIPLVRGMADLALQARVNRTLAAAALSLKNPSRGSTLHGDFTISFSNAVLLGIHFEGDSFTPGTMHPNKIDRGIHIDMTNGKTYRIEDLFRKGVLYEEQISQLCGKSPKRYRVKIPGLYDGWAHEDFVASWTGEDKGFLLLPDSLRVYTIPSYATGPIGGYRIPYASLEGIIDHKGDLWEKISYR